MLIVAEDDLDFADEYDPMHEVYHQSKPFTGVAKTLRETTEYVNGNAHGRYEARFATGKLSAEGTYVDGECTALQSWYEDGTLRTRYQTTGKAWVSEKWDRDGVLAYRGAEDQASSFQSWWYYKNGRVKQHYTARQGTDYFASDGRLAMQVRFGAVKNSVRYTDDVLKTSYMDVLTQYHYEQEAGKETANTEWYFWGWWWRTLEQDEPMARCMLNHLDKAGFHTAGQILINIKTIDLKTFRSVMGYNIMD